MIWDGQEERRKTPMHTLDEMHGRLARIETCLMQIKQAIFGNGNPERGFVVRIDRLEQAKTLLAWFAGVSLVSIVGLIINGIAEAMKR